jgi:hypothetical protein
MKTIAQQITELFGIDLPSEIPSVTAAEEYRNEPILFEELPQDFLDIMAVSYLLGNEVNNYAKTHFAKEVFDLPVALRIKYKMGHVLSDLFWLRINAHYIALKGKEMPNYTGIRMKDGKIILVEREPSTEEKLEEKLHELRHNLEQKEDESASIN